jgi:hypothetical protein
MNLPGQRGEPLTSQDAIWSHGVGETVGGFAQERFLAIAGGHLDQSSSSF